jgi:outer membrane lipoprotein-sorting protein
MNGRAADQTRLAAARRAGLRASIAVANPALRAAAKRSLGLSMVFATALLVAATTAPTTQSTDPQLAAELAQVDAAAGRATALSADFRQEKFTPLLRRPLVSTGRVVARGDTSLWTTAVPRPSTMRVTATELRIYYPDQSIVEVYPVQGQLAALAASPLPRLDTLRQFFTFARLPSSDAATLAVDLTPSTDELRQHVRDVRVTLDRATGAIRRAETTDVDGARTVLTFDHVDLHAAVTDSDLTLVVPPGTQETRPMSGVAQPGGR